jgi:hypothetical protein
MVMFELINYLVNYTVVLLLDVVPLMAGSTTGVPMSLGYGEYQSTTYADPTCNTEVFKCYTTKGPEYYTITCAAQMLLRRSSEIFLLHYLHHAAY